MWRAFFLGIGTYMIILGGQFLAVEKTILRTREPPPAVINIFQAQPQLGPNQVVATQPWWPWSLMSTGAITCLYSFTIPRRMGS
jgi:hypothetical protein